MTVTGEQLIEWVNAGTTEAEIVQYHPDLVTAEVDRYDDVDSAKRDRAIIDLVQFSMLPAGTTSQGSCGTNPGIGNLNRRRNEVLRRRCPARLTSAPGSRLASPHI